MKKERKEKCKFWKRPIFRQTFVISGMLSMMFAIGISGGTATVMIPQLKNNTNEIPVSEAMSSWIYSVQGFSAVPTVITMPYLNQWKGYRFTFAVTCIPILLSYIMQYFASSAVHLLLAGIFQGTTQGGILSVGIMIMTDFAAPKQRSLFLAMKSAAFCWGIWVANIIGTFLYWRYIPLIAIWPALFSFLSCFAWPDGPYWLASKGRLEECETSFRWLRGAGRDTEELASIIKAQTLKQETVMTKNIVLCIRATVTLRHFYMPVFVNGVLYCLYYFTGKIVLAVYALVIIKDITKDDSTAYFGMLIIDGVTVLGMYIGSYVAMKVRRRSMLLVTSALTVFFLYAMSIYLCMVKYQVIYQNRGLSLCILILYSFSVSWGPMVLCTSFTSEITPMKFKPFVMSLSCVLFFISHAISLKFSPILFTNIGMHGTFAVYGTLTLICWLYLCKYLPDTSNKTLQELETYFVKQKEDDYYGSHRGRYDEEHKVNESLLLRSY